MPDLTLRHFPHAAYATVWQAMRDFTDTRTATTPDEIWIVEHLPVYTLGQNGDPANIVHVNAIPVVKTDRGGQVTYHGPGQLVVYPLLELARYHLGVRSLVSLLENSVITLLAQWGIEAQARCDAPGVYVADAKICSIGLRIRRGCTYHGLALNVAMDLTPFSAIHPCGYVGLRMTQLQDLGLTVTPFAVADKLVPLIIAALQSR